MSKHEIPASEVRFGDVLAGRAVLRAVPRWDGSVRIEFLDDGYMGVDGATALTVDRPHPLAWPNGLD